MTAKVTVRPKMRRDTFRLVDPMLPQFRCRIAEQQDFNAYGNRRVARVHGGHRVAVLPGMGTMPDEVDSRCRRRRPTTRPPRTITQWFFRPYWKRVR